MPKPTLLSVVLQGFTPAGATSKMLNPIRINGLGGKKPSLMYKDSHVALLSAGS